MMSNWLDEMKAFEEHEKRMKQNKEKVDWLKEHLPTENVLIKADFIQNYEYTRGQESDEAYYNKKQIQIFTFMV